ncbi:hypothetical protein [Nakamurella multipartita]|uniref:Uncharacterized protein n=1 Tax=Nakamurella multipartita (strain ATCC 700099 / DSM 44233 / CIP 104796 / JCM 9543 / NBRC 105858 / Y-104) TaxID=479431 RepID=C8XBJ3_NAKMY|nr:hypothetical protein [Nakamurella multipartita]ACV77455.1 hypothetical protein Namu_1047 [Nakamurella multipartita DSM 44233]
MTTEPTPPGPTSPRPASPGPASPGPASPRLQPPGAADPERTAVLTGPVPAGAGPAGAGGWPIVVDESPQLVRGYQPPPATELPDRRTSGATDVVTCPECGQLATVNMARRSADDFCRTCDFPLFWAKGTVIAPDGEESGASLRRLPGTVGRAATASLICPHCAEPNAPSAEICVRCALSLHPVDIPEPEPQPEPEPIIVFEPDPEPEPVPAPGFDWWWVVAGVMALVAIVLIVLLIMMQ